MGGWRRFLEDLNLILPLIGVFVGAVSFAFVAGGWFAAQQPDLFLATTIGGAVGLLSSMLTGYVLGHLPVRQLKRSLSDLEKSSASDRAVLEAAQRQLETKLGATVPAAQKDQPSLPPPSVQVWLRSMQPADELELHSPSSIPILLIANLKGGVAKTMTAANLAAYFACRNKYNAALSNKRVLLIDLDYQGSLTNMALNAFGAGTQHPETNSKTLFLESISHVDALHRSAIGKDSLSNVRFFPCEYGFDDFETRAQFEWLGNPSSRDIRLSLLRRLRSTEFQTGFDLIIIDTGPRLTTASIAALAASTHLLVPTTSDRRSTLAAEQFLRRVVEMKRGLAVGDARPVRICPNLKVAGILQTLTTNHAGDVVLQDQARESLTQIVAANTSLAALFAGRSPLLQSTLKRSTPMVDQAQVGIPYTQSTTARHLVNVVGREIEERLAL